MRALGQTSLTDLGKPEVAAAPVEMERGLTETRSSRGESLSSPLPTHDAEFWDNTGEWRSGPDGFF